MERYIKVKRDDEVLIYDIDDYAEGFGYYKDILNNCLYYGKYNDNEITYLGEIVKESDNLKELFDEFIAHNHKASPDVKDVFSIKEELYYALDYMKNGYSIYGAIWTDKGLIYVAKLNDKGEFELL